MSAISDVTLIGTISGSEKNSYYTYCDAISRTENKDGSYEYVVDPDKCIGCGFCAGVCPCGVWEMVENL